MFFSFSLYRFNLEPSFFSLGLIVLAAIIFLLVAVFQSFLVKSLQLGLYLSLANSAALFGFFLDKFSKLSLFGALILAASLVLGHRRARADMAARLKVNFFQFSHSVVLRAIFGVAVFISFFYAGLYQTSGGISFKGFQFLTQGTAPLVRGFVPDFDLNMEVDDFFLNLIRNQFAKVPQIQSLTDSDRLEVFHRLAQEFKARFSQSTKVAAEARESVLSYFYRISNRYLKDLGEKAAYLPLLAIIFVLFWVVRGVLFFAKWLVLAASQLVYSMLKSFGVIYLENEPRNKEIIMIGAKRHPN